MRHKSNTKDSDIQHRKVIIVGKSEIKTWSDLFSLFGYKKECSRVTGVAPETIKRIMKNGKGIEATVASIREYYRSQQTFSIK